MKRGYFVTGTGTGVGKTFVTCRLAELARQQGQSVFAFKPIETGCTLVDEKLVGADQELLTIAAGGWQRDELRNLYCFERPLAPLAAARAEQRSIDLDRIGSVFDRGAALVDVVFVEGAGGWRVPITETADMSTLAKQLGLPIVVVAAAGLGTINHTLLTIEAIKKDGCELHMVVLSVHPEDDRALAVENAEHIRERSRATVLLSDALAAVSVMVFG